jgi:serine/threonine-protein kinase ATR
VLKVRINLLFAVAKDLHTVQSTGVFRTASEITMQLLRANKDVLMNVLDAFIHDPLVEWEDEKRKRVGHLSDFQ